MFYYDNFTLRGTIKHEYISVPPSSLEDSKDEKTVLNAGIALLVIGIVLVFSTVAVIVIYRKFPLKIKKIYCAQIECSI